MDPLPPVDPNRYEILAEHGRGGLGRVYRARDKQLGRDVALKELLKPHLRAEARFLREALITASLEHPGIVPIHDTGRWPDGTPFYAMKLVAGRPLDELLAETTDSQQRHSLLSHLLAVADALAYAHDRNIIHRDLKPANIIIGEFGETVVIDWGLAKHVADVDGENSHPDDHCGAGAEITIAGSVLGTPSYMSPEQAGGRPVDARSDVYSLGAILYRLSTGAAPEKPCNADNVLRNHSVHRDLCAIISKCLAPSAVDRYPNAGALSADLRAFNDGSRVSARSYSLVAILRLWLKQHRTLALAVILAICTAFLVGGMSFFKILNERDRASEAQRQAELARESAERERLAAEQGRDRATRSEASLLLEQDPTKARNLLASQLNLTPEATLLLARAEGAPPAQLIIPFLPYKTIGAVQLSEQSIMVVTSDNRLREIEVATGRVRIVANNLLEPPLLIPLDKDVAYARRGNGGPEIVRQSDPGIAVDVGSFRQSADNHVVSVGSGSYLLGRDGDLYLLDGSFQLTRVARQIRGIVPYNGHLLACSVSNLVEITRAGKHIFRGPCRHDGGRYALAAKAQNFVFQPDSSTIRLYRFGQGFNIRTGGDNALVMAESGLVAGVDPAQNAWFIRADENKQRPGPVSDSTPTALAADGDFAVWGYDDGSLRARDVISGTTWTFTGHSSAIAWVFVSSRSRTLVAVGGPEVRVWRIPNSGPQPVARLSCSPFNLVPSMDGRLAAFDCDDGTVSLLDTSAPEPGVRILHRHSSLSFGVTWWGTEVCSSGWDGRVLCTDSLSLRTKTLFSGERPVRFVHGNGDTLAFVVEDGTVWRHARNRARSEVLYRHGNEPYRVAVNVDGDVASGDSDGQIGVYQRSTGEVSLIGGASARIFDLQWQGSELVTTDWDGAIRRWNQDLSQLEIHRASRPIRELRLMETGWVANVDASQLWFHVRGIDLFLDTGPLIRRLFSSPDQRFVAALINSDVIVYDSRRHALAAIRIGGRGSGCAQFVDPETVIVCGPAHELLSISMNSLAFVVLSRRKL